MTALVLLLISGDISDGVAFRQKHMFQDAEKCFERALYIGKEDSALAEIELAITYYKWKKFQPAVELFEKHTQKLNPETWDYYLVCLAETDSPALLRLTDSLAKAEDSTSLYRALHGAWIMGNDSLANAIGLVLSRRFPKSSGAWEFVKTSVENSVIMPDTQAIAYLSELADSLSESPFLFKIVNMQTVMLIRQGDTAGAKQLLIRNCQARPEDQEMLAAACGLSVIFHLNMEQAGQWGYKACSLALKTPFRANGLESPEEKWLRVLFLASIASAQQEEGLWNRAQLPPKNNDLGLVSLFNYAMGVLEMARHNPEQAKQHFLLSVITGAPRNRWPSMSLEKLKTMGVKDPVEEARKLMEYHGMRFRDATGDIGLSGVKSSRVAAGDFNRDGWVDLLFRGRLFQNKKGKFVEVGEKMGINAKGSGALFVDYNNDGWDDVLITGKTKRLFENRKGKRFVDVSDKLGLSDSFPTEGATAFDLNNDGWPEIYLANYESGGMSRGTPDQLLMNQKGVFKPVVIGPETLCGRGAAACDFNGDGWIDLYITNYRLQRNFFYINHQGTLRDTAFEIGLAGTDNQDWFGHSIGAQWGDFDNDGDFDLMVCNLAHPRYIDVSDKSALYQATGWNKKPFEDVREQTGIGFDECHSEPLWADFDNDGDLDLFITSIYKNERTYLYQNMLMETGKAVFKDITYLAGARVFNGWSCVALDFDNDGDLDIAVGSSSGFKLLENTTDNRNQWLRITGLPRGAVIRLVSTGSGVQTRQIEFAKGTTSQNPAEAWFGLGENPGPVAVEVSFKGRKKTHKIKRFNESVKLRLR